MKKIVLIITKSSIIRTFRYNLILKLKTEYEVHIIAFDNNDEGAASELGVKLYSINADNRAIAITQNLALSHRIKNIIMTINPDKVMTFMLKPNIFGVLAARNANINEIYSVVEGAGDVFINKGLKWAIIRIVVCILYRKAFKFSKRVVFLNNDDCNEFISRRLVDSDKTFVIPGIGVNLENFQFHQIKNYQSFIMVARMLKTKGVFEYCEIARRVKKMYPDAVFNYLGAEGTVRICDIQEYIEDGTITYLGAVRDVRPYLIQSSVLLLLSYREGLPVSVMEAEATGRAIITSDSIGCRDTVKDGYNGFIVKHGDINQAVEKVVYFIEHPSEVVRMGRNSRVYAETKFDQTEINNEICSLVR